MGAVSDHQNWQAPGGSQPPPPSTPVSPYAGSAGAPPVAAPLPSAHGWTPPPKPGLVPLRPMTLGTILAASFQVMRRNPRTTLVPALLVGLLLAIASSVGVAAYLGAMSRLFDPANAGNDVDLAAGGALVVAILAVLLGGALGAVAMLLLQGVVVAEVARGTVGDRLRLGELWSAYRGRIALLLGYGALVFLAIVVGAAIVIAVIALLGAAVASSSSSSSSVGAGIAALFGVILLGYGGAIALFLWLGTKLAFVPAAIVLERRPILDAIRRSWNLTRGSFWRILGITLLVGVMIGLATQLVTVPVMFVASFVAALVDPTAVSSSNPDAMLGVMGAMLIATYAVTSIVSSIGLVVQSATASLLYLDQRMRREGLDLELVRFVEARQAGSPVPDPYLPRAAAP